MRYMAASITETIAVGLIVFGAAAYLALWVLNSVRGRGTCCGRGDCGSAPPDAAKTGNSGASPFVSLDSLADRARELAGSQRREGGRHSP